MASVYVGTWSKYNRGNLYGAWIDLEEHDEHSFNQEIHELHSDEDDPEFLNMDWEGVPDGMVTENGIEPELWDWLELNEDERQIVEGFRELVGEDEDIDTALEMFAGEYPTPEDFAEEFMDEIGYTENLPDWIRNHIDWKGVWCGELRHDYGYTKVNGSLFFYRTTY